MHMVSYLKGVLHEFKYIRWLSVRRTVLLSSVVIFVALIIGFLLGALDSGFSAILKTIVI